MRIIMFYLRSNEVEDKRYNVYIFCNGINGED
jgi:hypothetical protein